MLSAMVKFAVLVLVAVNYLFADVWTLRKPPRSGGDPDWNACYESDHFACGIPVSIPALKLRHKKV